MAQQTKQIPVSSIILDEDIYPRKGINHRRVGIFSENLRDGFTFDPIEVEPCPDKPGYYRLLDGAHRWSTYKSTGVEEVKAIIKDLDGNDPLLYAATKAIGPKQLTEDEARDTARRAYSRNSSLSSADIGKAIGRARRTVDGYIADLIIFDPPYFDKKAADYDKKSISGLSRKAYLEFLAAFFILLKQNVKKTTRMAFINADWRDFQNKPAIEEKYKGGILLDDYLDVLKKAGWYHTHIIQAPMSSQRFNAGVVSAMQKKNILGVISRYVIVLGQEC